MVANVPWDGAILKPRGIIGRIYVKHHLTLLHTKYTSALGLAVSEKIFFHMVPIISLWQIITSL